jgi:L-lactate dehydrogenase (cytochrome)
MSAVNGAEVAKHNNKNSCWIVLDSNVYDVTSFIGSHPGGAAILLKQAGTVSFHD